MKLFDFPCFGINCRKSAICIPPTASFFHFLQTLFKLQYSNVEKIIERVQGASMNFHPQRFSYESVTSFPNEILQLQLKRDNNLIQQVCACIDKRGWKLLSERVYTSGLLLAHLRSRKMVRKRGIRPCVKTRLISSGSLPPCSLSALTQRDPHLVSCSFLPFFLFFLCPRRHHCQRFQRKESFIFHREQTRNFYLFLQLYHTCPSYYKIHSNSSR